MNEPIHRLSRSAEPPKQPGVFFIECPKGDQTIKFTVFSPVAQGVEMHWRAKERVTVPCFTNRDLCPGGHQETTLKWRAYVFGYSHRRHENCFVQLTAEAWRSWMAQCREGANLRGQIINVHRTQKNNGRLWVEIETWRDAPKEELPLDQDCTLSCYKLWRFHPSGGMIGAKLGSSLEIPQNLPILNGVVKTTGG